MPFENLGRYFQTGINFIKQAISSGGCVLVHCYAGISRSASVVIAYLMQEMEMPMFPAMSFVRQRRPIIFPNPGFQKQLMEFEKSLKTHKKQKGDRTNASAPTQNANVPNYSNFTEQLNNINPYKNANHQQSPLSPHRQKQNMIEKVYSSPISKNLMHQKELLEQKYISQSADKHAKQQSNAIRLDQNRQQQQQQYGKQNQIMGGNHNSYIQRAHTSQVNQRTHHLINGGIGSEVAVKQELMNRLNNQNQVIQNSQQSNQQQAYSKQNRAKSSYGKSNKHQDQYNDNLRKTSDNRLPIYSNGQDGTPSFDPNYAYFNQQSQSQLNKPYNQPSKQSNTLGNSLYNSITRQKQDSQESLALQINNHTNQTLTENLNNQQYFCDHCSIPLFTSKDLVDHQSSMLTNQIQNNTLSQRSQQKFNSYQQNNHQSKLSLNGQQQKQQIFGKTFTDMSTAAQQNALNQHKCGTLFIRKKDWIIEQDGSEGNIVCPRKSCAVKIGSYCWQGTRCSTCGQFVSPAFQIFRTRIKQRMADPQLTTNQSGAVTKLGNASAQLKEDIRRKQNQDHMVRTPDQKRKQLIGAENLQNQLNLSYTADSKKSHSKSRRQHSNIEDLVRLKQGYQGLVQSLQKAQIINNQNSSTGQKSSKSKNDPRQERDALSQSYQQKLQSQLNYHNQQLQQQQPAQAKMTTDYNKNSATQRKISNNNNNQYQQANLFGQGNVQVKQNLNNLYNEILIEQEKRGKNQYQNQQQQQKQVQSSPQKQGNLRR